MHVYPGVISKEEDGSICVRIGAFPGCVADGMDYEEAVTGACDALMLFIAEYIDLGIKLPKPDWDSPFDVAIAVEVTEEFVTRTKCLTVTEAAEELGVTKGRVSQMLSTGALQAVKIGNDRLVTIASVNERKMNKPKAGRPKKAVTA